MNLCPYLAIARVDHWFKNVFALPGVVLALHATPSIPPRDALLPVLLALAGLCLTASSNYAINEYLDAATDREHPIKKSRPAARGEVTLAGVLAEWLLLGLAGVGLGAAVSVPTALALASLWLMGVVYNVRPLRTKEKPYLDVLSEAVNNPIRLVVGWVAVGTPLVPPLSLLLAYWLLGAYFMGVKRYAEYRQIGDPAVAAAYRRSFAFYDEERLLVSLMAYATACSFFSGMFIIRYKIELILAAPLVAGFFATYLRVGMQADSATITPEKLYRNLPLMGYAVLAFLVCLVLLAVEIPGLAALFDPSIPS